MISQFLGVHIFLLLYKNITSIHKQGKISDKNKRRFGVVIFKRLLLTIINVPQLWVWKCQESRTQLKKKQTHLGFQIFVHWDLLLTWQPLSRFHKLHPRSCNKEIINKLWRTEHNTKVKGLENICNMPKHTAFYLFNFQFQAFFTFVLQMSVPCLFHGIRYIAGDVLKEEIRVNN